MPFKFSRRRAGRGCVWTIGILAVVGSAAWFTRSSLLPALARAWIVNESPDKADAIVVLGGNLSVRAAGAAKLLLAGHAPRILITFPEPSEVQKLGLLPTDGDVTRTYLLKLGVAPDAIESLPDSVTSTRDEALALKKWCADHHATRLIIPTDLFHTRRVNSFMEKTLTGTGTDTRVTALDHPRYTIDNWWQTEEGLIAFQNEVIKHLFYKIKY